MVARLLSTLVALGLAGARARSVELAAWGPASAPRTVGRWWRTMPRPANDGLELVANTSHVAASLPRPWTTPCAKTALLTDTVAVVRLLGGWKDDADGSEDLAAGQGCDGVTNGSLLRARLDAVVEACLTPTIVLDNVPWCFSPGAKRTTYGNGAAPADWDAYDRFVGQVLEDIGDRYGTVAETWYLSGVFSS